MSFETTLRLMEILLGLAIAQQSLEHVKPGQLAGNHRVLFALRLALALSMVVGYSAPYGLYGLWVVALWMLHRFQGPYNGGSDKMTLLILTCLCLVELAPDRYWQEMALSYLAVQLVLSYFVSGWVKVMNPIWRNGSALRDVFRYSAYPVSESFRQWADSPRVLWIMGWGVMLLELAFPLALLNPAALKLALVCTAGFHFANACFFGLNRFFWIWLCAYPALIWFQDRIF
ncbi:HTTM domain-containing protein [Epibacterium ulvae]|uniref:HTTM domain-containing protein n=1 Tax=Epibacterium ulvae TaxID=1156985 RepID=UPI001BFC633A|nr:HTTM domain-containing protein [Epibacterium ulvae]MBT8155747.1 HTTM domain-containing protein [Epibacterium ulvae]